MEGAADAEDTDDAAAADIAPPQPCALLGVVTLCLTTPRLPSRRLGVEPTAAAAAAAEDTEAIAAHDIVPLPLCALHGVVTFCRTETPRLPAEMETLPLTSFDHYYYQSRFQRDTLQPFPSAANPSPYF